MRDVISAEALSAFSKSFYSDQANILVMNAVSGNGLSNAARQFDSVRRADHEYSVSLRQRGITWQKNSGRCWMFAGFNMLRDRVMERLDLEEFSFSGSYLMFYDKLEKANFFLESVLSHLEEPLDGRFMTKLLAGLRGDGGEWEMFVSLIQKYGAVSKQAQPECVSTEDSRSMAPVVYEKLREYARDLRRGFSEGESAEELRKRKERMLSTIYRMYSICYGEPVRNFDFKVRTKKGEFICDRGITPKEFYEKYVGVDLNQYVNLTAGASGGREAKKYRYPDTGDVIEGKPVAYVSASAETLRELAAAQLRAGEPVWFGCDVGERSLRTLGILDSEIFDYELLFQTKFGMTREERFRYGQAHASHAMVFKGVDLDEDGKPLAWRVENSWGPDVGQKGMFWMTDEWFRQYTYQVIINRKYVPEELLSVYDGDEAIMLEKWEPLI